MANNDLNAQTNLEPVQQDLGYRRPDRSQAIRVPRERVDELLQALLSNEHPRNPLGNSTKPF